MVLGLRDYVHKTGFSKGLIGLSGGIDSAVTAVLAVKPLEKKMLSVSVFPRKFPAIIVRKMLVYLPKTWELNFTPCLYNP